MPSKEEPSTFLSRLFLTNYAKGNESESDLVAHM
jgi:hypothetical protein